MSVERSQAALAQLAASVKLHPEAEASIVTVLNGLAGRLDAAVAKVITDHPALTPEKLKELTAQAAVDRVVLDHPGWTRDQAVAFLAGASPALTWSDLAPVQFEIAALRAQAEELATAIVHADTTHAYDQVANHLKIVSQQLDLKFEDVKKTVHGQLDLVRKQLDASLKATADLAVKRDADKAEIIKAANQAAEVSKAYLAKESANQAAAAKAEKAASK
jgi:hypothetical protein